MSTSSDNGKKVLEFQTKYRTKEEKCKALFYMSDEEIDELIESCGIVQGKIFYASFKRKNRMKKN